MLVQSDTVLLTPGVIFNWLMIVGNASASGAVAPPSRMMNFHTWIPSVIELIVPLRIEEIQLLSPPEVIISELLLVCADTFADVISAKIRPTGKKDFRFIN